MDVGNNTEMLNGQKFSELVQIAVQNATGEGFQSSRKCLEEAFNDYFAWHEDQVEKGKLTSLGGSTGGDHNRRVLASYVSMELGHGVTGKKLLPIEVWLVIRNVLDEIAKQPYEEYLKSVGLK